MISHKDCQHAATPAARSACRKARTTGTPAPAVKIPRPTARPAAVIHDQTAKLYRGVRHCEQCGTIDPQSSDSYTECCNEGVCDGMYEYTWNFGFLDGDNCHITKGQIKACCSFLGQRKLDNAGSGLLILSRKN